MQKKFFILLLTLFMTPNCGQQPSNKEHAGRCRLDCSSPYVGSTMMRIRYLDVDPTETGSAEMSVFCAGESAYPGVVPIRFVIERPRQLAPTERDTTPIGGEISPHVEGADAALHWEPAGNVSFLPVINGGVTTGSIAEPKSQWCTDSCGMGVASFKPKCSAQSIEFGVYSGALSNVISINIQP